MALLFNSQNESNTDVFFRSPLSLTFMACTIPLMWSMSTNSLPREQTLCVCLSRKYHVKKLIKSGADCAYVKYAANYSIKEAPLFQLVNVW